MKKSLFTNVVGAGVILASLALFPTDARSQTTPGTMTPGSQNQMMQNQMMTPGSQNQMMTPGMQNQMMMMQSQNMQSRWYSAREFHRMGRHEWRSPGMMTQLITTNTMMRTGMQPTPATVIPPVIVPQGTTTTPGTQMR